MSTGVLGLGFAPTTATGATAGLLFPTATSVALLEALLLLAIAAVHTMAAGLAAASVSTSTVAWTSALTNRTTALADGTTLADGTALARRNNGRKERWERRLDGRRVATPTTWRIETTSSSTGRIATAAAGRIVALAFARRVVSFAFAFASASALSFATLALSFALAFAASKFLDEDVVAATAYLGVVVLRLLHGGILSREGVELPTLNDVGMELDGVVSGHIMIVMIILIGIGGSRST